MFTLAYIDPSVTTMLIQAGAALVVVVGGAVVLFVRRAKKKVAKVLNIDENKGKEVEDDIIETAEENAEIK